MRHKIALAAGVALTLAAHAGWAQQPQAQHPKEWYADHPAERSATLRTCQSDNSYAHLYDCRNASSGELLAMARSHAADADALLNPDWWGGNPGALAGTLHVCSMPTSPSYPRYERYCGIARATSILGRRT